MVISKPFISSFSKILLITERRLINKPFFLAVDIFSTFLDTDATDESFKQSGKQAFVRHMF